MEVLPGRPGLKLAWIARRTGQEERSPRRRPPPSSGSTGSPTPTGWTCHPDALIGFSGPAAVHRLRRGGCRPAVMLVDGRSPRTAARTLAYVRSLGAGTRVMRLAQHHPSGSTITDPQGRSLLREIAPRRRRRDRGLFRGDKPGGLGHRPQDHSGSLDLCGTTTSHICGPAAPRQWHLVGGQTSQEWCSAFRCRNGAAGCLTRSRQEAASTGAVTRNARMAGEAHRSRGLLQLRGPAGCSSCWPVADLGGN